MIIYPRPYSIYLKGTIPPLWHLFEAGSGLSTQTLLLRVVGVLGAPIVGNSASVEGSCRVRYEVAQGTLYWAALRELE